MVSPVLLYLRIGPAQRYAISRAAGAPPNVETDLSANAGIVSRASGPDVYPIERINQVLKGIVGNVGSVDLDSSVFDSEV
jgi:hypothetical protein